MPGEIFVCKSGSLYMWSDLLPDKDVPLQCRLENYVSSPLSDSYFEKIPIDNFSPIERCLNDSTVAFHAFASYVFQLNKWIYGNEKVHEGMSVGEVFKEHVPRMRVE